MRLTTSILFRSPVSRGDHSLVDSTLWRPPLSAGHYSLEFIHFFNGHFSLEVTIFWSQLLFWDQDSLVATILGAITLCWLLLSVSHHSLVATIFWRSPFSGGHNSLEVIFLGWQLLPGGHHSLLATTLLRSSFSGGNYTLEVIVLWWPPLSRDHHPLVATTLLRSSFSVGCYLIKVTRSLAVASLSCGHCSLVDTTLVEVTILWWLSFSRGHHSLVAALLWGHHSLLAFTL